MWFPQSSSIAIDNPVDPYSGLEHWWVEFDSLAKHSKPDIPEVMLNLSLSLSVGSTSGCSRNWRVGGDVKTKGLTCNSPRKVFLEKVLLEACLVLAIEHSTPSVLINFLFHSQWFWLWAFSTTSPELVSTCTFCFNFAFSIALNLVSFLLRFLLHFLFLLFFACSSNIVVDFPDNPLANLQLNLLLRYFGPLFQILPNGRLLPINSTLSFGNPQAIMQVIKVSENFQIG